MNCALPGPSRSFARRMRWSPSSRPGTRRRARCQGSDRRTTPRRSGSSRSTPRPGSRRRGRQGAKAELGAALESGALDAVIAPSRPSSPGLVWTRLFSERNVCLVRAGHPVAGRSVSLEAFCALPNVVVSPEGRGSAIDEALGRRGLRRRPALRVPSFLVAPWVVAASDLVTTLPARLARRSWRSCRSGSSSRRSHCLTSPSRSGGTSASGRIRPMPGSGGSWRPSLGPSRWPGARERGAGRYPPGSPRGVAPRVSSLVPRTGEQGPPPARSHRRWPR